MPTDITTGLATYQTLRRLGQGAFGEVGRGLDPGAKAARLAPQLTCPPPTHQVSLARILETGQLVALKRIYVRNASEGLPDNIIREMKSLQSISHVNVVALLDVFPKARSGTLPDFAMLVIILWSSLPRSLMLPFP